MTDSKGAAIDEIRKIFYSPNTNLSSSAGIENCVAAILAILAQEVKKARIDELKNIYRHFSKRTVGQVNKFEILDYMENRLEDLERLG